MDETQRATERHYTMPQLSDEFMYQLIFCMEDQANSYVLDLADGTLIQKEDLTEADRKDDERFLDLPQWRPADGFRVMEKFVASLRNPIYRQQLHDALARGKRVFREFKNVLKQEPAIERLWFYFKEKEIKKVVYAWYEQLTEVLYLKALGEPEENMTELILSDFIVSYDQSRWTKQIHEVGKTRLKVEFSSLGYPLSKLLAQEYEDSWDEFGSDWLMVFIESPSGDFAGFIGAQPILVDGTALVYSVKHLYVEPRFRGLGIFKLLADTLCDRAEEAGAERIVMEVSGKASVLASTLVHRGFSLIGERFALDLAKWRDIQSGEV